MTAAELRSLLERVEKHGGPHLKPWLDKDSLWWEDLVEEDGEAIAVGVLKRDLIERGLGVNTSYSPPRDDDDDSPPWTVFVLTYDERNTVRLSPQEGDSELEAVLRAWLAAAEAGKWEA